MIRQSVPDLLEENEALRRQVDTLTNTYVEFVERTRVQAEEANKVVDAEKALADDLADVLSRVSVGWQPVIGVDLTQFPDVQRVMQRYREARSRWEEVKVRSDAALARHRERHSG